VSRIQRSLNHTLYQKYASSQNYYYTRDINDILTEQRTKAMIKYKDQKTFDDDVQETYLKRFYFAKEYRNK
jgi:hypothetical protein